MAAIALAVSASILWGGADFLGGLQARKRALLTVLLLVQATGLVLAALLVAASGDALPDGEAIGWGLVAGVAGAIGAASLYKALAVGTMSIVAPLGALGAAVPVAVGLLADGERPQTLQVAGILLAGAGVVLSAREPAGAAPARNARLAILLALLAAVGLGGSLVGLERASDASSVPWALCMARAVMFGLIAAAALVQRPPLPRDARDAAPLVLLGVLDIAANGLFAVASTLGLLSVVGVLGSLYPAVTVVLARVILHERVSRMQEAGVVAVFVGIVAIGAG